MIDFADLSTGRIVDMVSCCTSGNLEYLDQHGQLTRNTPVHVLKLTIQNIDWVVNYLNDIGCTLSDASQWFPAEMGDLDLVLHMREHGMCNNASITFNMYRDNSWYTNRMCPRWCVPPLRSRGLFTEYNMHKVIRYYRDKHLIHTIYDFAGFPPKCFDVAQYLIENGYVYDLRIYGAGADSLTNMEYIHKHSNCISSDHIFHRTKPS